MGIDGIKDIRLFLKLSGRDFDFIVQEKYRIAKDQPKI